MGQPLARTMGLYEQKEITMEVRALGGFIEAHPVFVLYVTPLNFALRANSSVGRELGEIMSYDRKGLLRKV